MATTVNIPKIEVLAKYKDSRLVIEKSEYSKNLDSVPAEYKRMFDDFIYTYACFTAHSFLIKDGVCYTNYVSVESVAFGHFMINKFTLSRVD